MKNFKLYIMCCVLVCGLVGCSNEISKTANEANEISSDGTKVSNTKDTKDNNDIDIPIKETELKSFFTEFSVDNVERAYNIGLACGKLNGYIVEPNSEFSFLNIVGIMDETTGYKESEVIVDGKKQKGYGGGACQVSTTVFNAVDGLEGIVITEKHDHGKEVFYVPEGMDATVSNDSNLDFKFVNNTGYRIKLNVTSDGGVIKVSVLKIS